MCVWKWESKVKGHSRSYVRLYLMQLPTGEYIATHEYNFPNHGGGRHLWPDERYRHQTKTGALTPEIQSIQRTIADENARGVTEKSLHRSARQSLSAWILKNIFTQVAELTGKKTYQPPLF